MTINNAYKILDLSIGCTDEDLKKAYRKLSLIHHPDKGGSEKNFQLLTEAKELVDKHRTGVLSVTQLTKEMQDALNAFKEQMRKDEEEYNKRAKELRIHLGIIVVLMVSYLTIIITVDSPITLLIGLVYCYFMVYPMKIYNFYLKIKQLISKKKT
jgi:hypothetical protein